MYYLVVDSLTINLNAHKIEYLGSTGYLFNVFRDGQDNYDDGDKTILTINGDGEISTTGECIATAGEGGGIVINGGTHTTSGSTLYKSTGGKIEIIEGMFKSTSKTIPYVLLDGNSSTIEVKGGSYYNWDPSNKDITYNDPKNLLARTEDITKSMYICLHNKPELNWYTVTKKYIVDNDTNTGSKNELNNAFADEDASIIDVNNNVDYNDRFWLENRGDVTLNLNGNTFHGSESGGYSGVVVNNTQLTINDGNFTGGGFQVAYPHSKLILNNCNITLTTANTSARYCVYTADRSQVIFNGGNLKFAPSDNQAKKRAYFMAVGNSRIFVLDCVCGAPTSRTDGDINFNKYPIYTDNANSKVVIYNGEFGFDPTVWIADGAEVTKLSSTKWRVTTPGVTSSKNAETGKVTTVISYGTFEFDPTPWLDPTSTLTKTDTQWIVTAA